MQFCNTPEDCQWLKDTALRGIPNVQQFTSFVIHGNEDAPDYVDLYTSTDPLYTDEFQRADFREWALGYCTLSDLKGPT